MLGVPSSCTSSRATRYRTRVTHFLFLSFFIHSSSFFFFLTLFLSSNFILTTITAGGPQKWKKNLEKKCEKKKGKGWLTQLSKLSEDIFEKKINKQQWDWRKSYCSFKQNSFKLRDLKKQWILSLSAETTKVDLSHQNVCEFCECNRSRKSRQHLCLNIFVWQVCMIARKSPEHKPWNKNKVWKHVKCFILYYRPIPTNAPHHHFETKQTRFNGWSDFFSIKKKRSPKPREAFWAEKQLEFYYSYFSGFQGSLYALELFRSGTRVLFHHFLRWKLVLWFDLSFLSSKQATPCVLCFLEACETRLGALNNQKKGWKHEEFKFGKLKMTEKTWSPFYKPKSSETLVASQKGWKNASDEP